MPSVKDDYKIACNGIIIDADWNFFSSYDEAVEYFKWHCARSASPGNKYNVVKITVRHYKPFYTG